MRRILFGTIIAGAGLAASMTSTAGGATSDASPSAGERTAAAAATARPARRATFRGGTSQKGGSIQFRVDNTGKYVERVQFRVTMTCYGRTFKRVKGSNSGYGYIKKKGKRYVFAQNSAAKVSGHFVGKRKASGTLRIKRSGCRTTKTVRWTARAR